MPAPDVSAPPPRLAVSRMRNAATEAAIATAAIVLGAFGLGWWLVPVMTAVGLGWWAFVQAPRLRAMAAGGPLRIVGAILIAALAYFVVMALGVGLGAAIHSMLGVS